MLYELILINEIEQRAKIIFLSVQQARSKYAQWRIRIKSYSAKEDLSEFPCKIYHMITEGSKYSTNVMSTTIIVLL